uniref:Zinc finger protein n=1 Tax=Syphacia muris TaxID=451379 RepID=A0A0N5AXR6_9BILA
MLRFYATETDLSFDSSLNYEEHVAKIHKAQLASTPTSNVTCFYCGQQFPENDKLMQHFTLHHLEAVNLALAYQFAGQQQIMAGDLSLSPILLQQSAANTALYETLQNNMKQFFTNATEANEAVKLAAKLVSTDHDNITKKNEKNDVVVNPEQHYPCPQCPQIFVTKSGLRKHLFTQHLTPEQQQFTGLIPDKLHRQETSKQQEASIICRADKDVYRCIPCNMIFTSLERCNVHLAMEHPSQPLITDEPKHCCCAICKQSTQIQNPSKQQRSFKKMKDELICNGFRCTECGKLFPSRNHVEEHEAIVHQGSSTMTVPFGKFICQFCNEGFSNQDRLTKHIASRHRNPIEETQKAHKCTVCGKGFARTDMLSRICSIAHTQCIKAHKSVWYIAYRHMRLHKGDKPFACSVCGQEFSRSDHLTTHMRTHSGEKPYRCPFCCYAASRRDMMNRHLKTHSKSPEHIRAQEAKMNTEACSSPLNRNAVLMSAASPQLTATNNSLLSTKLVGNTATLLNSPTFSCIPQATTQTQQNQFLHPNTCILQYPQHHPMEFEAVNCVPITTASSFRMPPSLSEQKNSPDYSPVQTNRVTWDGGMMLTGSPPKIFSQQPTQQATHITATPLQPLIQKTAKISLLAIPNSTSETPITTILPTLSGISLYDNNLLLDVSSKKSYGESVNEITSRPTTSREEPDTPEAPRPTVDFLSMPVKEEIASECFS